MIEEKELKGIIKMLNATTKMAEHLRMTHDLDKKSAAGVRQYNGIMKRLNGTDTVPADMFTPLEEDASFVDLGMCCEQLAAYLGSMVEEPAAEKKFEKQINAPHINISGGMPDLDKLGELIRQAMPSWLREQMEEEKPEAEEEEKKGKDPDTNMNDVESRIAELGAQMQVLAERMHREEMSSDEIRKLADQMRELGQQQSELARKHAAVRAVKETDQAR